MDPSFTFDDTQRMHQLRDKEYCGLDLDYSNDSIKPLIQGEISL